MLIFFVWIDMKAERITSHKSIDEAGGIIHLVIWKVPRPVPPSTHEFKYRLVYVKDGRRIIGFDNERGKGDHMHLGEIKSSGTRSRRSPNSSKTSLQRSTT